MAMQKQLPSVHPMHEMPCLTAAARRGEEEGCKNRLFSFSFVSFYPFLIWGW